MLLVLVVDVSIFAVLLIHVPVHYYCLSKRASKVFCSNHNKANAIQNALLKHLSPR